MTVVFRWLMVNAEVMRVGQDECSHMLVKLPLEGQCQGYDAIYRIIGAIHDLHDNDACTILSTQAG